MTAVGTRRNSAALLLAFCLTLAAVVHAPLAARIPSRSQESFQPLRDHSAILAAPRQAHVLSAKTHRPSAAGPAPFAALPQLAACLTRDVHALQLPRGGAVAPSRGRSPPFLL